MKMSYLVLLLLFSLSVCSTTYAQKYNINPTAKEQIDNLRNGTLLIKLNTESKRINHRLNVGAKKQAEKLIKQVEAEHEAIIKAFMEHYNFSDYYFFLSDDSKDVIIKKDYSKLFKIKNDDTIIVNNINNPFVLILGIPPGYSTVDKYKFILHELGKKGIEPIVKPMPKVFKTQSKSLFSNKYDFIRAVSLLQNRLLKFNEKVHLEG